MAFPTVVSATESAVTADDTSPWTVSRAAGVSGQLTLVVLCYDGTNQTLTWPTNYVELFNFGIGLSVCEIAMAYYQEDGSEGTTFDISVTTAERWAAIVYSISGAENPATQAPEHAHNPSSGTNPDPPSLTPTGGAKDYLWIAAVGTDGEEADDDTWVTAIPTNYSPATARQKTSGTAGAASANVSVTSVERQLNAATEDPGTFTIAQSLSWRAVTVAIHPAAPVDTAPHRRAVLVVSDAIKRAASRGRSFRRHDSLGLWLPERRIWKPA